MQIFRNPRARLTNLPLAVSLLLALFVVAGQIACSNQNQKASQIQAPAGPVQKLNPDTVGEIRGTVLLKGTPPAPKQLILTGQPECQQLNPHGLFSQEVITGPGGGLANVAVYIQSGLANYHFTPPAKPAVLEQKDCMFQPLVIGVMTNQTLDIQNEDPIEHNVHGMPHNNPQFNLTQSIHGAPLQRKFANPELAIPVVCNLHTWMRAFVFVFPDPYFAVTNSSGTFDLKNVPPGTYTIEAWHDQYGKQDQTVVLGPKETKNVTFTFSN